MVTEAQWNAGGDEVSVRRQAMQAGRLLRVLEDNHVTTDVAAAFDLSWDKICEAARLPLVDEKTRALALTMLKRNEEARAESATELFGRLS